MRGFSTITGKNMMIRYILENLKTTDKILDVGFGQGAYGYLLRQYGYRKIDGVDAYPKNMDNCIKKTYRKLFFQPIQDFNFNYYDLIIMGDVLEHLTLSEAQKLLENYINNYKCTHLLISIPYEMPVEPWTDNHYEKHLQNTVNKAYIEKHYPYLTCIFEAEMDDYKGNTIAIYKWNQKESSRPEYDKYGKIPKIIHQIWLGNPMPNRLKKYCQSWKEHHPDWEYKLWTEENLPELQNQELYDNAKTYAERSDIIRLEILKKYGGIYVDCDIECKHNIEYLIGDSEFIVCQDLPEWPRFKIPYLNNALMGCTPNHPLIKRLIDELPEHCNEYSNEHVVFRTGPGFLSLRLSGEDVNRIEHGVKIRGERVFIHRYQNTWVNVEPQPRNFWK